MITGNKVIIKRSGKKAIVTHVKNGLIYLSNGKGYMRGDLKFDDIEEANNKESSDKSFDTIKKMISHPGGNSINGK